MNKKPNILTSWELNAQNWINDIDQEKISSRKLVTNQAIISTVQHYYPRKVLDLGCGEGWLTRALHRLGILTIGIDGTENLIANARTKGEGIFEVCSYEEIIAGRKLPDAPFDAVVINFGLFTNESTEALLLKIQELLLPKGKFFIQTLHPCYKIKQNEPYRNTWEDNGWAGLGEDYTEPFRWYFRTLESWVQMFTRLQLRIIEIKEPLHPETYQPASMIFVLETK